jgi:hypothetical protein
MSNPSRRIKRIFRKTVKQAESLAEKKTIQAAAVHGVSDQTKEAARYPDGLLSLNSCVTKDLVVYEPL